MYKLLLFAEESCWFTGALVIKCQVVQINYGGWDMVGVKG